MAGFVAEGFQRRVQELVDVAVEGLLDFGALPLVELGELVEQPPQLLVAERVPAVPQALDDRAGGAVVQVGHEALRFIFDDGQRPGSSRSRSRRFRSQAAARSSTE